MASLWRINPHTNQSGLFLRAIGNHLDKLISNYDNILLIGYFNCAPHDNIISDFCNIYNLKYIIKEPTCFKSTTNPSCIDLILKNKPNAFQNTIVLESGLSDFL